MVSTSGEVASAVFGLSRQDAGFLDVACFEFLQQPQGYRNRYALANTWGEFPTRAKGKWMDLLICLLGPKTWEILVAKPPSERDLSSDLQPPLGFPRVPERIRLDAM